MKTYAYLCLILLLACVISQADTGTEFSEALNTLEKIPWIGPYISKFIVYGGFFSSFMTAVSGVLLVGCNFLIGLFTFLRLPILAARVAQFRDGRLMYWLQFFSIFNAKMRPRSSMPLTISEMR